MNGMKINKRFSLKMKKNRWTFILQDDATYLKEHGDDSRGITDDVAFTVHFNEKYFNKALIMHELGHCYFAEYTIDNVEFTKEQVEEIFCTILENDFIAMDKMGDKIYNFFIKYMEKRSTSFLEKKI